MTGQSAQLDPRAPIHETGRRNPRIKNLIFAVARLAYLQPKMHLPININDLIRGKSVEWERLEFKAGWNPLAVLHTLCAFANDFHNLGGGYIVIGVEERAGQPILPPAGLAVSEIDSMQKEVLNLGHNAVQPFYHPIIVPTVVEGKHLRVLWVPGGQTRPYRA